SAQLDVSFHARAQPAGRHPRDRRRWRLGGSGSVADADMKTALAALMGIVALGGFAVPQPLKYQRQSLKYHTQLADNVDLRNVNNNAGILPSSALSGHRPRLQGRTGDSPGQCKRGSPEPAALSGEAPFGLLQAVYDRI